MHLIKISTMKKKSMENSLEYAMIMDCLTGDSLSIVIHIGKDSKETEGMPATVSIDKASQ
jgi:hypothetical protein